MMSWTVLNLQNVDHIDPSTSWIYGGDNFKTYILARKCTLGLDGNKMLVFQACGDPFAMKCKLVGSVNEDGDTIVDNENLGKWYIAV
jgi:hypothetical protein